MGISLMNQGKPKGKTNSKLCWKPIEKVVVFRTADILSVSQLSIIQVPRGGAFLPKLERWNLPTEAKLP